MAPRPVAVPTTSRTCAPAGNLRTPSWLPRQRRGTTPQMIGRYPDFDVFDAAGTWDAATAKVVNARLHMAGELRFFSPGEAPTVRAFCDVCVAQDGEPRVPVVEMVDEKLAAGRLDGYQYADMPDDRDTWRLVLGRPGRGGPGPLWAARFRRRRGRNSGGHCGLAGRGPAGRRVLGEAEHKAGLVRVHAHDPGRVLLPPLGVERDRLRRPRLPPRLHAPRADQHPGTVRAVGCHRRGPRPHHPEARSVNTVRRACPGLLPSSAPAVGGAL